MSLNKHVETYLDYYCALANPTYAVLLKGQWGCGKSHFIATYQQKSHKKYIYISLYGLKEVTQIDEVLFQATNPRLGSKGMGVASKIIASSLKSTVKVDVSSSSTYLKKLLSKTKDSILIFDDLERCDIPLKQVFGYINDFVEHEKRHVIIIADVSKVEEGTYLSIKEKLIGQELEIQLDIEEAFKGFCTSVKNETCKTFLSSSFPNICSIYKTSGYNNLRTLRKVIQDFEWFFEAMPTEAHDKNDLLQDVLNTLLILSLEIRSGNIKEQDITALFKVNPYYTKKEDDSGPLVEIRKKYSFSPILGEGLWQRFFETGTFNKESLEEAVFNSQYFQSVEQESWVRLWHSLDLSDDDFEAVKKEVQENLNIFKYKKEPIIVHLFGLYIWMAQKNLCEMKEDDVSIYFKEYVDELVKNNTIELLDRAGMDRESYASLGYFSKESPSFQDFCDYLDVTGDKLFESSLPNQAQELLSIMVSDVPLFNEKLGGYGEQKYRKVAILSYITPTDFMSALDKTEEQRDIEQAIKNRYDNDQDNKGLLKELPWLKELKTLLEKEIEQRTGKISGYRYRNILDLAITPAITKLQAIKDNLDNA